MRGPFFVPLRFDAWYNGAMNASCARFLLSFFGLGFVPAGKGTTAALASFTLLFVGFDHISEDRLLRSAVLIALFALTVTVFLYAVKRLPHDEEHDPHWITLDEVSAMILLIVPYALFSVPAFPVIATVFAFGFFDVLKPFGIRRIDNLQTHGSILFDDWVAALAAMISVYVPYLAYAKAWF